MNAKKLQVLCDLIILVTGYYLEEIAIAVKASLQRFDPFVNGTYIHFCNVLIATGFLMVVFGFTTFILSLRGPVSYVPGHLSCSVFSFGIIFLLAVAAGIGGIILQNNTKGWTEVQLVHAISKYGNKSEITASLDNVQNQLTCCGIYNYTDWNNFNLFDRAGTQRGIPLSCCKVPSGTFDHFYCNTTSPSLYSHGCLESFGDSIINNNYYILYGGVVAAVLQLIRIGCSIYAFRTLRSEGYEEM